MKQLFNAGLAALRSNNKNGRGKKGDYGGDHLFLSADNSNRTIQKKKKELGGHQMI